LPLLPRQGGDPRRDVQHPRRRAPRASLRSDRRSPRHGTLLLQVLEAKRTCAPPAGSCSSLGPPPCSANGHIIGNALVLVFDRRTPPPPAGLAVTAINFAVVEGDVLF